MSLYNHKPLLPQWCVNNVSYGLFILTNTQCHCHVNNFSYYFFTPRRSMLSQYSVSIICSLPLYSSMLYDVDNVSYYTCTQTVCSVVVICRCLYSSNSLLSTVLYPTISQLQVVATLIIIVRKKTVSLKNQSIQWLLRHYAIKNVKLSCSNDHSPKWLVIISAFWKKHRSKIAQKKHEKIGYCVYK